MTARQGVRVTSATTGPVTPGYEELSGGYRWHKIPGWKPGDVRFRQADAPPPPRPLPPRTPSRADRLAEYARLRDAERLTSAEAGARLGIRPKTAETYERDSRPLRKQQQRRSG